MIPQTEYSQERQVLISLLTDKETELQRLRLENARLQQSVAEAMRLREVAATQCLSFEADLAEMRKQDAERRTRAKEG